MLLLGYWTDARSATWSASDRRDGGRRGGAATGMRAAAGHALTVGAGSAAVEAATTAAAGPRPARWLRRRGGDVGWRHDADVSRLDRLAVDHEGDAVRVLDELLDDPGDGRSVDGLALDVLADQAGGLGELGPGHRLVKRLEGVDHRELGELGDELLVVDRLRRVLVLELGQEELEEVIATEPEHVRGVARSLELGARARGARSGGRRRPGRANVEKSTLGGEADLARLSSWSVPFGGGPVRCQARTSSEPLAGRRRVIEIARRGRLRRRRRPGSTRIVLAEGRARARVPRPHPRRSRRRDWRPGHRGPGSNRYPMRPLSRAVDSVRTRRSMPVRPFPAASDRSPARARRRHVRRSRPARPARPRPARPATRRRTAPSSGSWMRASRAGSLEPPAIRIRSTTRVSSRSTLLGRRRGGRRREPVGCRRARRGGIPGRSAGHRHDVEPLGLSAGIGAARTRRQLAGGRRRSCLGDARRGPRARGPLSRPTHRPAAPPTTLRCVDRLRCHRPVDCRVRAADGAGRALRTAGGGRGDADRVGLRPGRRSWSGGAPRRAAGGRDGAERRPRCPWPWPAQGARDRLPGPRHADRPPGGCRRCDAARSDPASAGTAGCRRLRRAGRRAGRRPRPPPRPRRQRSGSRVDAGTAAAVAGAPPAWRKPDRRAGRGSRHRGAAARRRPASRPVPRMWPAWRARHPWPWRWRWQRPGLRQWRWPLPLPSRRGRGCRAATAGATAPTAAVAADASSTAIGLDDPSARVSVDGRRRLRRGDRAPIDGDLGTARVAGAQASRPAGCVPAG